jgi:hypothetical protein
MHFPQPAIAPSSIHALIARIRDPSFAGRKCVATFVLRAVSTTKRASCNRIRQRLVHQALACPFFIAAIAIGACR